MTDHSDSKDKVVESLLKSSDDPVLDGKKEETPKKEGQPLSKAVLKQIEYYFSNNNLWRDSALQTEIAKDPDGWVSVALVADFPRVKALSSDVGVVVSALRLSKKLELSGESKSLRRVSPVPPYNPQKDAKRTVYVDNLPSGSTLKSVRKLFAKFGRVTYVTKIHPIGEPISPTTDVREAPPQEVSNTEEISTALVEFAKKEAAKKAVALIQEWNEKNPVKTPSHLAAIRESKDQIILEEEPDDDDAPETLSASTTSPEKKSATPARAAATSTDASTTTPTKTPVLDTLLEPSPAAARFLTTPSPAGRGTSPATTLSPATPYTPGSYASPSTLSTPSTPSGATISPAGTPGSSEKKEKEIDMNNYTGFFVLTKLQYLKKIGFAVTSSGSSTPGGSSKQRTPRGKQGSGSKRRSSLNWRADKDEDSSSEEDSSPEPQHTPRSRGTSGAGSSRTPSRQETRAPSRGEQRAASRGENRAASRGEVRASSRGENRTPSRGEFFPRERQGSNSRPGSSHGYRQDRDRDRNRSGSGRRSSLDQNGSSEYSRDRGGSGSGSMPSHRRARSHSQDLGLPPISDTEERTRTRGSSGGGGGGGDEGSRPILKLVSSRRASTGTVMAQRFAKGPDETGGFLAGKKGAGRGRPTASQ